MSLEQWSYLGNVVAAVAVVASLVFVGLQTRQNTRAVRNATSQAHSQLYADINALLIEHADMARIWRLGLADLTGLKPDERIRFVAFASTVFRYYESSYVQWRRGQLDAEHWHMIAHQAVDFMGQPGIQAWWTMRRQWHSDAFRQWVEGLARSGGPGLYEVDEAKAVSR